MHVIHAGTMEKLLLSGIIKHRESAIYNANDRISCLQCSASSSYKCIMYVLSFQKKTSSISYVVLFENSRFNRRDISSTVFKTPRDVDWHANNLIPTNRIANIFLCLLGEN
jgi:hypothetical protein